MLGYAKRESFTLNNSQNKLICAKEVEKMLDELEQKEKSWRMIRQPYVFMRAF